VLESGNQRTRFSSVDALLAQATGTAVPLHALFDWLAGKNTSLDGWTADLDQRSLGRINAKRVQPAPQTDLRIVLDQ
jgi:outer membrane lipoprotein LolB